MKNNIMKIRRQGKSIVKFYRRMLAASIFSFMLAALSATLLVIEGSLNAAGLFGFTVGIIGMFAFNHVIKLIINGEYAA